MACYGNLVERLLNSLAPPLLPSVASSSLLTGTTHIVNVASSSSIVSADSSSSAILTNQRTTSFIILVISLLSSLCRGSNAVAEQVIRFALLSLLMFIHKINSISFFTDKFMNDGPSS